MKRRRGSAGDVAIIEGRRIVCAHRGVVVAIELVHWAGLEDGEPHFSEVFKDTQHMHCGGIHNDDFAIVMDLVVAA